MAPPHARNGAARFAMAIVAQENAARLSGTAAARSERLLRAAGFAADLGQPETVERLLREADLDRPAAACAGTVRLDP